MPMHPGAPWSAPWGAAWRAPGGADRPAFTFLLRGRRAWWTNPPGHTAGIVRHEHANPHIPRTPALDIRRLRRHSRRLVDPDLPPGRSHSRHRNKHRHAPYPAHQPAQDHGPRTASAASVGRGVADMRRHPGRDRRNGTHRTPPVRRLRLAGGTRGLQGRYWLARRVCLPVVAGGPPRGRPFPGFRRHRPARKGNLSPTAWSGLPVLAPSAWPRKSPSAAICNRR